MLDTLDFQFRVHLNKKHEEECRRHWKGAPPTKSLTASIQKLKLLGTRKQVPLDAFVWKKASVPATYRI